MELKQQLERELKSKETQENRNNNKSEKEKQDSSKLLSPEFVSLINSSIFYIFDTPAFC